jgi:hypothetical protein
MKSLTHSKEHRVRVFENRVLREIFVSTRDEVIGKWKRLHDEKLHYLYSAPNISQVIKSRSLK